MNTYYSLTAEKTTPSFNFLTTSDVKNYLKQESSVAVEDSLIADLSEAAQNYFERKTNRALVDGSLSCRYFDIDSDGPSLELKLPYIGTFSNIVVQYRYDNTTTTLVVNTDYYVNDYRIRINKTAFSTTTSNVEVIITADVASDMTTTKDAAIVPALYRMVADFYNYRD